MAHAFAFDRIVPEVDQVAFKCTLCGAEIWFSKPGLGTPAAVDLGGGTWATPDNPDQWIDPCPLG
jgi:hypothetical protein